MVDYKKIALIDYGMGNLRSVSNALLSIGADPIIVSNPGQLGDVHGIILPGVGAFPSGMNNLHRFGFVKALDKEVVRGGKLMLGICLGMQLLATIGHEHNTCDGLNLVPGQVDRLSIRTQTPRLRIPHIGWNDIQIRHTKGLYTNIPDNENFYFVHSYAFKPANDCVVSATCCHGIEFAASLEVENISAVQFHPEKSHRSGIKLLKNWLRMVEKC